LGEASGRFIQVFYLLSNINPSGSSSPSSHRKRDNPFLGQYTLKSQEIRKWSGIMMESGKYGREQYGGSLREFLVANPFPRKTTYEGTMPTTTVK
jgi:hypothetical protein